MNDLEQALVDAADLIAHQPPLRHFLMPERPFLHLSMVIAPRRAGLTQHDRRCLNRARRHWRSLSTETLRMALARWTVPWGDTALADGVVEVML